ncbi:hypothetical protein AYI83_17320 [Shewanella algae]|uniref:DISARM system phospholipase D-like protein DrmC n=1 Tax=Shewanella algae TaxID=38313 RepID=UPI001182E031|nr:DISARM system phospholipase D-like protein DrmC [Shewanella algae]TVK93753.1 hypothetical protein AYI83_17320 [Shewanella algae]
MNKALLVKVAQIGSEVHPSQVELLANYFRKHKHPSGLSAGLHLLPLPLQSHVLELSALNQKVSQLGNDEIAVALMAASATQVRVSNEQQVSLVWTGPETPLVPTRQTKAVLLEIINKAQRTLWITSFVAYEVPAIRDAIVKAAERGVDVRILLEPSTAKGGTVSFDSIAKAQSTLKKCKVFRWRPESNNTNSQGKLGAMHAKCVVSDAQRAFITSANISNAAIERNMELGVLVKGSGVAKQVHDLLTALEATGIVEEA